MTPALLTKAAGRLNVELDSGQCERLGRYVALVEKWNRHFNLISRRDIGRLWPRHVLDSLSVLPVLRELSQGRTDRRTQALDVGTGAGFPGMPLAIADVAIDWLLVDRNTRKIRFLELVVAELGLTNVATRCLDLAQCADPGKSVDPGNSATRIADPRADVIVSRAVADPAGLVRLGGRLLRPGGAMLLMTGTAAVAGGRDAAALRAVELSAAGFKLESAREVAIPELGRCHQLMVIRHS